MTTRFFVGNVSYALADADDLARELAAHGIAVWNVRVVKDRESGQPRGFGFFDADASADTVIGALDGAFVAGRPIRVALADRQPEALCQQPARDRARGRGGRDRGRGSDDTDAGDDDFRSRRRAW